MNHILSSGDGVTPSLTTTLSVNTSAAIPQGIDLFCYECSEKYDSTFDPTQAPCLNNLSQITVRQCSPADRYCQVRRQSVFNCTLLDYYIIIQI